MKKVVTVAAAVILMVGLMGMTGLPVLEPGVCLAGENAPVFAMATPLVKMNKKAEVVIMGTGFKPGQSFQILISAADGTTSNIAHDMEPEAKADANGSFACTWSAGRYISKGLIKGGAVKFVLADPDYNPIAQSTVFFQKEKEEKKK